MGNPYDYARMLAKSLRHSPQYIEYEKARKEVLEKPSVKEMIEDLQKKQYQLQSRVLLGKELTDQEKEQLKKLQEIAFMHETARRYLEAEHNLLVMLTDIQKIIGEAVDIGFPSENGDEEKTEENN